jgi:hypothetical protein
LISSADLRFNVGRSGSSFEPPLGTEAPLEPDPLGLVPLLAVVVPVFPSFAASGAFESAAGCFEK